MSKVKKLESPVGTYKIDVISIPEECDFEDTLPIEIQYIFKKFPAYKEKMRTILANGKAIGVRTVLKTPENVLRAVHTVAVFSQYNYILTWLPELLKDKHYPTITDHDRFEALKHDANLDEAIEIIVRDRLRFKRLVLIDEENIGIKDAEQRFMTELSELIYPLQVDYAVHRVVNDNAHERTKVAQTIVKALLIVGPIAHILEKFAAGVGKVFAAFTDDLLGEAAELTALRGSGFTWRQLIRRSRILIPVLVLATWGAYSVEELLATGHMVWGGIIFGFSAVALSLTTAIQSFFMYRKNATTLAEENKIVNFSSRQITRLAIKQDFTNPARLGLFLGASMAPFFGVLGSFLGVMHNGWVLAAIGSTESIVAGITVLLASQINEHRFRWRLQKSM